ncbi:hypothetical protein C8T65DRAFT_653353 [Cerioporus squamosus]|nr:hypothetical protein C8T65DRAFT_653353 [Cerioporus squamosus]
MSNSGVQGRPWSHPGHRVTSCMACLPDYKGRLVRERSLPDDPRRLSANSFATFFY